MSKPSILNKTYGWKPDLPDNRDHYFTAVVPPANLPTFVDLTSSFPTVYNQQSLGSCTANAIAGAIEFDQIKQKLPVFIPSRLFIYYNERALEGTVSEDAGAMIRDGVKTINTNGVCPETEWPYAVTKFATKPPTNCFTDALKHKAVSYQRVNQDLTSMRSCLASGYGFVVGFTVYESFESDAVAASGVVPMPTAQESVLGGHAVVAVGYNDGPNTVNGVPSRTFVCRNSWGPSWGKKGYFYMPYEYLTNSDLSDDFWKITVMS